MKFVLSLNPECLFDALIEADGEGVNLGDATMTITGTIDKDGKVKISKSVLVGTVEEEYVKEI